MKQNFSKTSGADDVDASGVDVLAALTSDGGESETRPAAPGLVRRMSTRSGAAVLAIAAAILTIGLAGGAVSAAAASIPESEAMAAAETDTTASVNPVVAGEPTTPTPEHGPVAEGRWQYSLAPVQWGQRDAVLAANLTPPPQPAGYGWALVELSVRNVGVEAATPGRFEVVLHSGGWEVSHLAVGRQPLRMPGEYAAQLLQPGEQAAGNLGFWIPDHASASSDCVVELRVFSSTDAAYTSHWLTCD